MMLTWMVEVLEGAPVEPEAGIPMEFGTPTVSIGDTGEVSGAFVSLTYCPVGLHIEPDHAWLSVGGHMNARNFRWMYHLSSVTIDWSGRIRICGMEERADGALVTAVWVAEPSPTRPIDAG